MAAGSWPTIQGRSRRMASPMMRLPFAGKLLHSPQPWTPASVSTRTNVQTFCGSSLYVAAPCVGSTTYTSMSVIFVAVMNGPGRGGRPESMEGDERLGDRALRGAQRVVG